MEIGLIGVGRMGRVLAKLLVGHVELCLFDRNIEQMKQIATELNITTVNSLKEIVQKGTVILAVPDNEVINCVEIFNQINSPIRVINIATNVTQQMLEKVAAVHVKCISIKIIGHANEIALGQRPVIIVDEFPADSVLEMVEIFQSVGQVLVGKADIVHSINTIAAQKAIEAAVGIEEALREQNITEPIIIKNAIRQVAAGILKAYADGDMGPFAQEIVQSLKSKKDIYITN